MQPRTKKRPTSSLVLCTALLAVLLLTDCGNTGLPARALNSLVKVNNYPLYVMHYYGDYGSDAAEIPPSRPADWACSLFAALGDEGNRLYGRNWDWEHSPAVLLYTYPVDGYASISMVNLSFLGFDRDEAGDLLALGEAEREPLLRAPFLPIDGMNAAGLVVGMAAVPWSQDMTNSARPVIGSLGIIREMLDHAATVDEATAIMEQYTISFAGGPPIHYLIADATGKAVLVEYGTSKLHIIPNDGPWHVATNFLVESANRDPHSQCWRYRTITQALEAAGGDLTADQAMGLLEAASQEGTQWSAVYEISNLAVTVALDRRYAATYTFYLDRAKP